MLFLHAQVVDTEGKASSPASHMGPVADIAAGTVTIKTEEFPLPANALVSQSPCRENLLLLFSYSLAWFGISSWQPPIFERGTKT